MEILESETRPGTLLSFWFCWMAGQINETDTRQTDSPPTYLCNQKDENTLIMISTGWVVLSSQSASCLPSLREVASIHDSIPFF